MGQMIRKQIYLDADNERFLKERSRQLGITEAEVVRLALAEAERRALAEAEERAKHESRVQALENIMAYIREHRMRDVPQTGGWKFNRDELYEERMDQIMRRPAASSGQANR